MKLVPLDSIESASEAPVNFLGSTDPFEPVAELGVSRFSAQCPRETALDALLVNKGSDVLVVGLHGATVRSKFTLPRFEWFRTLRKTEYNSLYFSDPTLCLSPKLELAWYTGWLQWDAVPHISDWISTAAAAVGAKHIVVLGSSGGGFAALQIASQIPGAIALPFNAQTAIGRYYVQGRSLGAQRRYMSEVMPHLTPNEGLGSLTTGNDYFRSLGARSSAVQRYKQSLDTVIYYVQNTNDFHHVQDHYEPFRASIESGPNSAKATFELYDGPEAHNPPPQEVFKRSIVRALEFATTVRGH